MIKVVAIRNFTLKEFDKIEILKRASKDEKGHICKDDIFTCDIEMANYLLGNNGDGITVIRVIEITPEKVKQEVPTITNVDKALEKIQESAKEEVKITKKTSKKKK